MIKGIGIDCVFISEIQDALSNQSAFERYAFTKAERAQAETRHDKAAYLAGRFAVKEALTKACCSFGGKPIDMRYIETLDQEDGRPQVTLDKNAQAVLSDMNASEILVSISNEANLAIAIALVQ